MIWLPVLGLVVGSFIGLVSLRWPAEQDIVAGRSRCAGCARTLAIRDLIPVLSYTASSGRCRTCRARIPVRYPLLELACAGIGLWAAAHQSGPLALVTAAFGWTLLLIAVIDAEHYWLPDALTLPLLATGLIAAGVLAPGALADRAVGAAAGFAILWGLAWIYRRLRGRDGLGGGDPRLFAAIGAWVGWMGLPTVLLWACGLGLSLVAARLALRKPVAGRDQLPFGVFLAIGVWLTWLYGPLGV